MNRPKARTIAAEKLRDWLDEPPHEISDKLLNKSVSDRHVDESGKSWAVNSQRFWEDEEAREMRVIVTVDDGGLLSSIFPEAQGDVIEV